MMFIQKKLIRLCQALINDDKRLQTYGKITTCPYGTNAFKVCESEMLKVKITK